LALFATRRLQAVSFDRDFQADLFLKEMRSDISCLKSDQRNPRPIDVTMSLIAVSLFYGTPVIVRWAVEVQLCSSNDFFGANAKGAAD
jgi:hypothetical protein